MKTASITLQAHAKINLFLDITGVRDDGYHNITGVMHSIPLCDGVVVSLTPNGADKTPIHLTCDNPNLPTDQKNLGYAAAMAFFRAMGWQDNPPYRVDINIQKRIPAAAGMAGGSTDAAAVLRGLNTLLDAPLDEKNLLAVGLTLGADVPFCLMGGTQITQGIGEALTPVSPLPPCPMVVACGGSGVSTPAAYHALDEKYCNFDGSIYTPAYDRQAALLDALTQGDIQGVAKNAYNIFESVVLPQHPTATQIKHIMQTNGATLAMMSGSGPSVFGIFPTFDTATEVADTLVSMGISAWAFPPQNHA